MNDLTVQRLQKTIVVVDLAHFTKTVHLYEILGQSATRLAVEIEGFFLQAYSKMGLSVDRPVSVGFDSSRPLLKYTGDGAILHFDVPERAVEFAELIQEFSMQYNGEQQEAEAKRVFRVGVATGEVEIATLQLAADDLAGGLIGTAARLEAACSYGHVLIDETTWRLLPEANRSKYRRLGDRDIGKDSDCRTYTAYERGINENASDDLGKQSAWRIYRKPESVVDGIIWRLRNRMPDFNSGWRLLNILEPGRAFNTASELVDWAVQVVGITKVLGRIRGFRPACREEQHWAEELLLLFSCRSLNFSIIKPLEQVNKQSHQNNAALVGWISSTSAFVVAACMAGLTGFRVYLGPTAGALEIKRKNLLPVRSAINALLWKSCSGSCTPKIPRMAAKTMI